MDAPATAEAISRPVEAPDRPDDQNPAPPARIASTGCRGSPDAPVATPPSPAPHVNGNGATSPVGDTTVNGNGASEESEHANGNGHHIGYTLAAWALVSYGSVQMLGRRVRSSEIAALPPGEPHPPADFWREIYLKAPPE